MENVFLRTFISKKDHLYFIPEWTQNVYKEMVFRKENIYLKINCGCGRQLQTRKKGWNKRLAKSYCVQ